MHGIKHEPSREVTRTMRNVRLSLLRFHLQIAMLLTAGGVLLPEPSSAEVERVLIPKKSELSFPNQGFKVTVNLDKGSRSIVIQRQDSKLTISADEIGDFPINPASAELQVSKDFESKPWPSELRLVVQSFMVGRPGDFLQSDCEEIKFVVRNGQYTKRIRDHRGAKRVYYSKAAGEKERVITRAEYEVGEAGEE
ncbi:hypothetical protein [Luteolibacter marinus]|uniref:hypothetical protein n=1 Tax=Luteolibacter marinus TaxID=2776705 RepID=UPI00186612FF|nr:hypothetical protein [Luteolibacter marinus]